MTSPGHVKALDGVRGIAIGSVMLLHSAQAYFPGGAVGVDLFFALSAYLITSLILQETSDNRGRFSFASFYARRALRLGPALVIWLAIVAAPTAVVVGEADTDRKSVV